MGRRSNNADEKRLSVDRPDHSRERLLNVVHEKAAQITALEERLEAAEKKLKALTMKLGASGKKLGALERKVDMTEEAGKGGKVKFDEELSAVEAELAEIMRSERSARAELVAMSGAMGELRVR